MTEHSENKEHHEHKEHPSGHTHHEHKAHHEPVHHKKLKLTKANMWRLVSAILVILLIISVYTGGFNRRSSGAKALTKEKAANKAIAYINTNLIPPGADSAKLISVEEEDSLYVAKISIGGREYDSYVTKDGSYMFPSGFDMDVALPELEAAPEAAPADIPKTEKPEVELFVMSQCPYGTIAEKAMAPVLELMGGKFDFRLHFIANDNGDGTFKSLHGQAEVDEGIRQVCAAKHYPSKYVDYVLCVNEDYRNAGDIWEKCAKDNGIDAAVIKKCTEGEEGKELFSENIAVGNEKRVGSSPTLLINGVSYSGARTAEGYKQAICSAFEEIPEECGGVELDTTSEAPTGNC